MVQVDGVQGYDEDQIALVIPDLSGPCSIGGPHDLGNPHNKSCHEHNKRKGDRPSGYTLGKYLGGLSSGSLMSYNHNGR